MQFATWHSKKKFISNNKICLLISSQFHYSLEFFFEKYYFCPNDDRGFRLMFCENDRSKNTIVPLS